MQIFRDFILFFRHPFKRQTLEETIADQAVAAIKLDRESQQVIVSHRFQQHMARATLNAIHAWCEQEGWTDTARSPQ